MRLLVLGGTRFLSREVAARAVARGWEVTCACRGESGTVPDGATHLRWDRSEEAPDALRDGGWDAVVDVARLPSHVRRAVAAVPDAHWVFVSTINVYADNSSPAMEPPGRAGHRGRRPRHRPGGVRRDEGRLRVASSAPAPPRRWWCGPG